MIKRLVILGSILVLFGGCKTQAASPPDHGGDLSGAYPVVAVLPIHNLSGAKAPLDEIRQTLERALTQNGVPTLDSAGLQQFIVNHRIRHIGGMEHQTARSLHTETGAQAVFQTTLEIYHDFPIPKLAILARVMRITGAEVETIWMDGVGLAGDDAPGLLDLGVIKDPQVLLQKSAEQLIRSFTQQIKACGRREADQGISADFQPRSVFGGAGFLPDKSIRVAVTPFFNFSERKYAGDLMALHFVRQLTAHDNIIVSEPADVRKAFLQGRLIMNDGISLTNAKTLFRKLGVDYILSGSVLDYEDEQGGTGKSKVHSSVFLIEKNSLAVVWSADSVHDGDESASFFFGLGRMKTAHSLAAAMSRQALATIFRPGP